MSGSLRIFQIIERSTNCSLPQNETWLRNLHLPLLTAGHNVVLVSAEPGREAMRKQSPRLRSRFSQEIQDSFTREHKKKPFDLVFAYLMDGMIDPSALDIFKENGVPSCNFSCNNTHQFYLVKDLSPHFDVNLHAERDVSQKFTDIGATPLWWPMASNPDYFSPVNAETSLDASFTGANYGTRAVYAKKILDAGIDFHLFGPGWQFGAKTPSRALAKLVLFRTRSLLFPNATARIRASAMLSEQKFRRRLGKIYKSNMHAPVSDEELIALYSRSRMSVGFLEVYDNHDPTAPVKRHMHLRDFEAPMCGAAYITGYTEEVAECFEPDKEVAVYSNTDELVEKLKFYLSHPMESQKLREAGRRRALEDHTYEKRFQQLFQHLGLQI